MKTMSIGARVPEQFARSLAWFAKKENQSTSAFVKRALSNFSHSLWAAKYSEMQDCQKIAQSMQAGIDEGDWKERVKYSPDLYPATLEGWESEVAKYEALAKEADEAQKWMTEMLTGYSTDLEA